VVGASLDIPLNDPAEFLLFATVTIDMDVNADETAILYDGDEEDERDFDMDIDNPELSWYLPVMDLLTGLVDDDEPLLSPILTIMTIVSGAYIDSEEEEEEDALDGIVDTEEERLYRPAIMLVIGQ
jgi:hypothetical protein